MNRALLGAAALTITAAVTITGCSSDSANPSPTGPTIGPPLDNVCAQVDSTMQAIAYFKTDQPPPTAKQLDQAAAQIAQHRNDVPADSQKYIDQIAAGLRTLATTPPGQRTNSAPGKAFSEAYAAFGQLCAINGSPLSATPSAAATIFD